MAGCSPDVAWLMNIFSIFRLMPRRSIAVFKVEWLMDQFNFNNNTNNTTTNTRALTVKAPMCLCVSLCVLQEAAIMMTKSDGATSVRRPRDRQLRAFHRPLQGERRGEAELLKHLYCNPCTSREKSWFGWRPTSLLENRRTRTSSCHLHRKNSLCSSRMCFMRRGCCAKLRNVVVQAILDPQQHQLMVRSTLLRSCRMSWRSQLPVKLEQATLLCEQWRQSTVPTWSGGVLAKLLCVFSRADVAWLRNISALFYCTTKEHNGFQSRVVDGPVQLFVCIMPRRSTVFDGQVQHCLSHAAKKYS